MRQAEDQFDGLDHAGLVVVGVIDVILFRVRADDQRYRAVAVHVVHAVLRVVLHHDNLLAGRLEDLVGRHDDGAVRLSANLDPLLSVGVEVTGRQGDRGGGERQQREGGSSQWHVRVPLWIGVRVRVVLTGAALDRNEVGGLVPVLSAGTPARGLSDATVQFSPENPSVGGRSCL